MATIKQCNHGSNHRFKRLVVITDKRHGVSRQWVNVGLLPPLPNDVCRWCGLKRSDVMALQAKKLEVKV